MASKSATFNSHSLCFSHAYSFSFSWWSKPWNMLRIFTKFVFKCIKHYADRITFKWQVSKHLSILNEQHPSSCNSKASGLGQNKSPSLEWPFNYHNKSVWICSVVLFSWCLDPDFYSLNLVYYIISKFVGKLATTQWASTIHHFISSMSLIFCFLLIGSASKTIAGNLARWGR